MMCVCVVQGSECVEAAATLLNQLPDNPQYVEVCLSGQYTH